MTRDFLIGVLKGWAVIWLTLRWGEDIFCYKKLKPPIGFNPFAPPPPLYKLIIYRIRCWLWYHESSLKEWVDEE